MVSIGVLRDIFFYPEGSTSEMIQVFLPSEKKYASDSTTVVGRENYLYPFRSTPEVLQKYFSFHGWSEGRKWLIYPYSTATLLIPYPPYTVQYVLHHRSEALRLVNPSTLQLTIWPLHSKTKLQSTNAPPPLPLRLFLLLPIRLLCLLSTSVESSPCSLSTSSCTATSSTS